MSITPHHTNKGTVYEVRLRGPDGRERSRRFRTKRDAVAWEASQVTAMARGTWLDPAGASRTLRAVADEWLAFNPAKRATSVSRDTSALRTHILPALGDRRIGSITKPEVQKLVNGWATSMQPRTAARTYGTLRAVFNYAVACDWIGRSPCRDINLPARARTQRRIPTADELVKLADAMRAEYAPMVWIGAVTGLRWGEVAGLRAGHVDLKRRTITVEQQVSRGQGGARIIAAPKSEAGNRVLTIPHQLAHMLSTHIVSRGLRQDALLFPGPDGERAALLLELALPHLAPGNRARAPVRTRLPRPAPGQRNRHRPLPRRPEDRADQARPQRPATHARRLRPSHAPGRSGRGPQARQGVL